MSEELENRLSEIGQLISARDEINRKLSDILGISDVVNKKDSVPAIKDLCYCGREANHRGLHRGGKSKPAVKSTGRIQKCGNCGEPGHKSRTCPESNSATPKQTLCLSCDEEGHLAKDCSMLGNTIQKMKHAGQDSLRIAVALHISLADVNKHW